MQSNDNPHDASCMLRRPGIVNPNCSCGIWEKEQARWEWQQREQVRVGRPIMSVEVDDEVYERLQAYVDQGWAKDTTEAVRLVLLLPKIS